MKIKLEELLSRLGNPGRYQVFIFILLALNYFPLVYNHIVMAFFGSPPHHDCYSAKMEDQNQTSLNVKYAHLDNGMSNSPEFESINKSQSSFKIQYGFCRTVYYLENGWNETVTCSADHGGGKWRYRTGVHENNIVTEWDLVCEHAFLGKLATTIYFCGVMVGGLVFGYLADRFGRKPIMLFTLYTPVVVGIVTAFAQSYTMFVILRFIQGVLMQGLQISTYVLIMELFLPHHRGYAGCIVECFWGATVMSMAGVAYLLPNWRHLQLAVSIPSVLAIGYYWLVPESFRWLIMKNKIQEAEDLSKKMARYNKLEFPYDTWQTIKLQLSVQDTGTTRQYTVLDMLRTPILRKRSLILFYIWFVISLGYYGLTLKITTLAGNKYLNFFIAGSVEFVAFVLAIFIVKRFGCKKPLFLYFLIGALSCITAGAIPNTVTASGMDLTIVSTGFAIAGKFGMAGLFSVIFLFTSELYPTVIRNIGMGSCAFWTRFGGVMAPQVLMLGDFTHKAVPIILFGVVCLVGGIVTIFLPETRRMKLPDTIEDVENGSQDMSAEKTEEMKELTVAQNGVC